MRDFLEENSTVLVSFRRKRTCFQAKVVLLQEHYNTGSKVVKSVQNEAKSLLDEYDDDGHLLETILSIWIGMILLNLNLKNLKKTNSNKQLLQNLSKQK